MGHLAKPRDASFFRVFFNPYHYGVLTKIPLRMTLLLFQVSPSRRLWPMKQGIDFHQYDLTKALVLQGIVLIARCLIFWDVFKTCQYSVL